MKAAQQSVTRLIAMLEMNLVNPKAAAKCELLLNKLASTDHKSLKLGSISLNYFGINLITLFLKAIPFH
jgi:hypothetical protein